MNSKQNKDHPEGKNREKLTDLPSRKLTVHQEDAVKGGAAPRSPMADKFP